MASQPKEIKIAWYRTKLSREALARVNERSDALGWAQAGGHVALLLLTATAAWVSIGRLPLAVTLLLFLLHGTCYAFLLNGFHELCHKTVFKTPRLNQIFLNLYSFLGWYNPVLFWASHQEHHKYTLHPPYDQEVLLPVRLTLVSFLKSSLIDPWDFVSRLRAYVRLSLGRLEGEWEQALFPANATAQRQALFGWARLHLAGHALLGIVSLALGWWQIPLLVTLAPFYGGWLLYLCNNTQHVGLMDNVPDFRLCSRTILLHPALRFLYWHMNYHTEHHMYAAVPCYRLAELHALIEHDLPPCPRGLVATWRQIGAILQRQQADPTYQYRAELPPSSAAPVG